MNPELEAIQRQTEALADMSNDLQGADRASPQAEYWLAKLNETLALQPDEPAKAAIEEGMLHVALAAYAMRTGTAMTARQLFLVATAFFEAAEGAKANGRHESGTLN